MAALDLPCGGHMVTLDRQRGGFVIYLGACEDLAGRSRTSMLVDKDVKEPLQCKAAGRSKTAT